MTTYRERREAKAERLQEWATKRATDARRTLEADRQRYGGDVAFNTQPGHIPERARVIARTDRAYESLNKAANMSARASGIADQLDRAIYSDDANAIEALEARIATLEAERDAMKEANAAFRKAHGAALRALTPYQRDLAMPHQSFTLTNLSANIRRNKERLEHLRKVTTEDRPLRIIRAHRDGECGRCGESIEAGAWIGKYLDGWSHVHEDGDNWKRCV